MKIPSAHSIIKRHGILPKKRLGQHFLVAMPSIEKIAGALGAEKDDCVIEIGPGLGIMSAILAKICSKVIAIEHDPAVLRVARTEFGDIKNIEWIESDILKINLQNLTSSKAKIIGNLPYNISSPILFWMLENRALIERAVVMLQKEVAARVVSKPNCKDYGILSVLLQAHASCKKLFDVSAASFFPPPKVTSSVIGIDFDKEPPSDWPGFKAVVKAAFGKRRKTLRNALLGARNLSIKPAQLDSILKSVEIDGRRRPEALSVDEFIKLSSAIAYLRT